MDGSARCGGITAGVKGGGAPLLIMARSGLTTLFMKFLKAEGVEIPLSRLYKGATWQPKVLNPQAVQSMCGQFCGPNYHSFRRVFLGTEVPIVYLKNAA